MRVFTAGLATEINTFSPIPTDLDTFKNGFYAPPGQHPETASLFSGPIAALRKRRARGGLDLIEGTYTSAPPAGMTSRHAYETLRDQILSELKAALPVDAVVLGLHGAMVAHGYDDCEGDLLQRVRALAGPRTVVGAELDPHCHMTQAKLRHADVLVCFKEFPHIDFLERGEELVDMCLRAARGEIKPVMSVFDCRMIGTFPTTRQPMRGFVDKIKALEGKDGVLSISVAHCFPYADVPEIGTKVVVVTDGRADFGARLAETLGRELYSMRGKTAPPYLSIDEGITKALANNQAKPVVCADPADNAGGGAPSDSTQLLRRMIERGVEDAAIGPIWDPIAVRFCFGAGEGAKLRLRFGGKTAPSSGQPIDAEVEVIRTVRDAQQSFGNATVNMGDAASIRFGGIEAVLVTHRHQGFNPDLFTNLGIDPSKKRMIVVKSTNHFHAGFAPIATDVLYIDTGGPIPRDFRAVPYTRVRRPIWPLDEDALRG
ncbi:MAG TPA: M81 family metallopeptidase [Stellaceae bacterium]|nr:M81 family metallopeptidase [Stellaceae bacterium]